MEVKERSLQEWPVGLIVPHPQNRKVNRKAATYTEFCESVKAIGVQQPLIVRAVTGENSTVQCLSGHRRLAAAIDAGFATVPVDHRGEISDAEAFDILAISNLHEDLTPLEEGQRAAQWLDHYDQDAQAVAGKLGRTARWVVEHAQIYRGLIADWHTAAESGEMKYGKSLAKALERWTASHWAVIARLPQRIQLAQLKEFQSGGYCSFDRWSVKELEERIGLEMLSLAKAPFDVATCAKCVNRTGAQPAFLWADEAEGSVGDKEKCLDKKCYERKCQKVQKAAFVEARRAHNYPDAVPLSTLVEPTDWYKGEAYRKRLSELKKVHGKDLVIAADVDVVKKGKDWDTFPEKRPKDVQPAIIVAGKGGTAVVWIKPKAKAAAKPAGQWNQRDYEKERRLWAEKNKRLYAAILAKDVTVQQGLAVAILAGMPFGGQSKDVVLLKKHGDDWESLGKACVQLIWDRTKAAFARYVRDGGGSEYDWNKMAPVAKYLDIDTNAIAAEAKEALDPSKGKEPKKKTTAKPKPTKVKGRKSKGKCDGDSATCEIGCDPCLAAKPPEKTKKPNGKGKKGKRAAPWDDGGNPGIMPERTHGDVSAPGP